ncbi:hypothetical protein BpHYR1_049348, partial [Brachionus plicatilis]
LLFFFIKNMFDKNFLLIKKKNQNKLKRHKLEKIVTCGTCLNSSSFRKKRRNYTMELVSNKHNI